MPEIRAVTQSQSQGGIPGLAFSVTDTGIGMTGEQLAKLFHAFSQADLSVQKKYGGTGLGLVLCKRFAELMGGNISGESDHATVSVFTVELPAHVEQVLPAPPSTRQAQLNGLLILVIDDDPTVRDLMNRHLSKIGYRVESASAGDTGLERARELKPDVITLDVMLPGKDGWTVLSALKADPALAEIPVVMMTVVDEKQMGFTLGAADYLTKPIEWDRLEAALKRHGKQNERSLLIIEDDANTQDILVRTLKKHEWVIRVAASGRLGLEQVRALKPSLILLDMMMPEMDGFQFMQALRANPEWQDIPVTVITAKELTNEDRQQPNGQVEQIVQKNNYRLEDVVEDVKRIVEKQARTG